MAQGDIKPVYVIHGTDSFLQDEYRRNIISQIIGDADPQTSVTNFDPTAELSEVLDELRTIPFLGPGRVVIITDAEPFISAYRQNLENYLNSPSKTSSLILMVSSFPKNTRLYKLVTKTGEIADCSSPNERNLPGWVSNAAKKRGKKISPEAVQMLIEWRGTDLGALNGEMEKLSLYVGKRETITIDDAVKLVSETAGPGAFALTNAITAGNTPKAIKALSGGLTRPGEQFKLLGMIGWHLRKAMLVQQLILAGTDSNQACKKAKIFYGRGSEFLQMLKRRPLKVLQNDFRKLLAADLGMKTGTNPATALQQLVIELCS